MRRRYKVTIDLNVEVSDLTRERIERLRAARSPEFATPMPTAAVIERQHALLQQLLESPELLDEYLRYTVMLELVMGGIPQEYEIPFDEATFFRKLIEGLPPRERHYFRQALARGVLVDENEDFFDSFEANIQNVMVAEAE